MRARVRSDVRELGRDVTAAKQHDPLRQPIEPEEFGARDDVPLAWKAKMHRDGADGDKNETALKRYAADLDRAGTDETGAAMIGIRSRSLSLKAQVR